MESGTTWKRSWGSSYGKLAAIGMAVLAVLSPLYIDQREVEDPELEESVLSLDAWLPLLLVVLMSAIAVSFFLDSGFKRFDPNWIHRVGGSSGGILVILFVLALVLKCKASLRNWEG